MPVEKDPVKEAGKISHLCEFVVQGNYNASQTLAEEVHLLVGQDQSYRQQVESSMHGHSNDSAFLKGITITDNDSAHLDLGFTSKVDNSVQVDLITLKNGDVLESVGSGEHTPYSYNIFGTWNTSSHAKPNYNEIIAVQAFNEIAGGQSPGYWLRDYLSDH